MFAGKKHEKVTLDEVWRARWLRQVGRNYRCGICSLSPSRTLMPQCSSAPSCMSRISLAPPSPPLARTPSEASAARAPCCSVEEGSVDAGLPDRRPGIQVSNREFYVRCHVYSIINQKRSWSSFNHSQLEAI